MYQPHPPAPAAPLEAALDPANSVLDRRLTDTAKPEILGFVGLNS